MGKVIKEKVFDSASLIYEAKSLNIIFYDPTAELIFNLSKKSGTSIISPRILSKIKSKDFSRLAKKNTKNSSITIELLHPISKKYVNSTVNLDGFKIGDKKYINVVFNIGDTVDSKLNAWFDAHNSELFALALDEKGNILEANKKFLDYFGNGYCLAKDMKKILPIDFFTTARKSFRKSPLNYNLTFNANNNELHLKGIFRTVEINNKKRIIFEAADNTERKIIEKDLFADGPIIAFKNSIYQKTNVIEYMSESVKSLGYKPADFIKKKIKWIDLIHYEDKNAALEQSKMALSLKKDKTIFEYRIKTKKAGFRWLNVLTRIVRDKQNKITGTRGYAFDITRHKLKEEALKISEANLRAVINNSLQSFLLLDASGDIIAFNDETKARSSIFFGKYIQMGDSFIELAKIKANSDYIRDFRRALSGDIVLTEKIFFISHNLSYWFKFEYIPVVDENETIGVCLCILDITENKKFEEMIQNYIDELKLKQQQLEGEAIKLNNLNSRLKESESKLKELNINKDKFFSIIAHDLKSPIAGLISISKILYDDYKSFDPEELDGTIEKMYDAVNNLYKLTENLLEWARLQSNRIEFNPDHFRLWEIVEQIQNIYKIHANEKNIDLSFNIPHETAVFADKNMINTALRNVVSNAIKFTPRDGKVSVSVFKKNEFVEVRVKDSGVGFSKDALGRIFKIEERYSTNGTDSEKGTGLGLILCKDFIEKNGGKIWVESDVNKGSVVAFTIPKTE